MIGLKSFPLVRYIKRADRAMDRQQQTLQRSTFSSCRLASYMDAVCDGRTALDVTRQNARSVVMISADGYRELMETCIS